jgi:prevent-host-death family protein
MTMVSLFINSLRERSKMNQMTISKSKLKPRILEILRDVERTRKELIITDHGRPVLKILPYSPKPSEVLKALRGSVVKYTDPTGPIEASWNALS